MGHPLDAAAQPMADAYADPATTAAPATSAAPPPVPGVDAPADDGLGAAPVAGAAVAGAAVAGAGVAGAAAAGADPRLESTLPAPEDSDFLAGDDAPAAPADGADPFESPPAEGTEMAASAGDPKNRKVSPALIIVLLVVLFLAGAAAAVLLFAPGLVGLAFLGIGVL